MCGVPVDRADDYLQRLIAHWAIASRFANSLRTRPKRASVDRKVGRAPRCRPAGHTGNNHRGAAAGARPRPCICRGRPARRPRPTRTRWNSLLRLSTFRLATFRLVGYGQRYALLAADLARFEPREIVVAEQIFSQERDAWRDGGARAEWHRLCRLIGKRASGTVGRYSRNCRIISSVDDAGGVRSLHARRNRRLRRWRCTMSNARKWRQSARISPHARRLVRGDTLEIDAATRANLELTRTLGGAREGASAGRRSIATLTPAWRASACRAARCAPDRPRK